MFSIGLLTHTINNCPWMHPLDFQLCRLLLQLLEKLKRSQRNSMLSITYRQPVNQQWGSVPKEESCALTVLAPLRVVRFRYVQTLPVYCVMTYNWGFFYVVYLVVWFCPPKNAIGNVREDLLHLSIAWTVFETYINCWVRCRDREAWKTAIHKF